MTKTPSRLTLEADLRDQIGRHRVYSLVALCGRRRGPVTIDHLLAVASRERTDGHGPSSPAKEVLRRGHKSLLVPALRRLRTVLIQNVKEADERGVPTDRLMRVAVAAWDSGMDGAVRGYVEQADPDLYATGGDYSADVFRRRVHLREILMGDYYGLQPTHLVSALR